MKLQSDMQELEVIVRFQSSNSDHQDKSDWYKHIELFLHYG